jgi:hypothetical protein
MKMACGNPGGRHCDLVEVTLTNAFAESRIVPIQCRDKSIRCNCGMRGDEICENWLYGSFACNPNDCSKQTKAKSAYQAPHNSSPPDIHTHAQRES